MSPDYAPTDGAQSAVHMNRHRRFRVQLWPTLASALLIPLFLAAGQWQWNKAERKAQLQAELEALASR